MDSVTRGITQFVVLLLCFFLASSGSRGHQMHEKWQCNHDHTDFLHDMTYKVRVESEHHHVKKRAIDQPFRMFVYYDSSVQNNLSSNARMRLESTITKLKQFFETTLTVRQLEGQILFDRSCSNGGTYFFPSAGSDVRRCVQQCQPTTCGSTGIIIPDDHLKRCIQCNGLGSNMCETVGMDGAGVDADYVLYVSAVTTSSCPASQQSASNLLGFGGACQMEDTYDRPIGGFVNFCPVSIEDITDDDYLFAVAKHEALHGLAFSSGLFPFWRDENGDPRTARSGSGFPPLENGQFVPGNTTVQQVTYTDWQTRNGPVSHTVTMLVTPRVTEEAREHFNCSTLQGLELENGGGSGTASSHWEQRLLEYEGMTGLITSNPVFSRLTFALLEDSGWYGVNYTMADSLLWGRGLGCGFSSGSCGGYIQDKITQNESISPFCNRFNDGSSSCTLRRDAVSFCNLAHFTSSLPSQFQYFDSATVENPPSDTIFSRVGGNSPLSDYCPSEQGFSNLVCDDPSNDKGTGTSNIFAQTFGIGSRCVFSTGQWTVSQVGSPSTFLSTSSGAGCYKYNCSNGQVTVFVFGESYLCLFAGQQISVDVTHEGYTYTGTIICPSCLEICYDDFDNCPEAAALFSASSTTTSISNVLSTSPSSVIQTSFSISTVTGSSSSDIISSSSTSSSPTSTSSFSTSTSSTITSSISIVPSNSPSSVAQTSSSVSTVTSSFFSTISSTSPASTSTIPTSSSSSTSTGSSSTSTIPTSISTSSSSTSTSPSSTSTSRTSTSTSSSITNTIPSSTSTSSSSSSIIPTSTSTSSSDTRTSPPSTSTSSSSTSTISSSSTSTSSSSTSTISSSSTSISSSSTSTISSSSTSTIPTSTGTSSSSTSTSSSITSTSSPTSTSTSSSSTSTSSSIASTSSSSTRTSFSSTVIMEPSSTMEGSGSGDDGSVVPNSSASSFSFWLVWRMLVLAMIIATFVSEFFV